MEARKGMEFRVGLFVLVALVIGGTLTFVIGNQRNVFRPKTTYRAVFTTVGGLRDGSPVRIGGVDVGNVTRVELGADGKIHVEMRVIDTSTNLVREGSLATIGNKGLLGDKLVEVSPGHGRSLPAGSVIPSESPIDLGQSIAQASTIVVDAKETVRNLRAATETFRDEAFTGHIKATADHLATITALVAEGDGVAHQLLADREMASRVARTLSHAEAATANVAAVSEDVRAISREVRQGDGTAHRLIYGQEGARLVENLAAATGELATLMEGVRTGQGAAHEVLYGERGGELVENVTAMSADLRAMIADVRAGRGTVGGLLVDPSIYEDVKRLVGDLERNEILRALVRYSIQRDEQPRGATVEPAR